MAGTDIVLRPEQQLVAQLRSETFKEQVAMALPPSVTPDHFVRIASTAILTNPDIAGLERESVLRALMQCAADGLMPDGKEAAITPRRNKKTGKTEAVYVPMILGFRKKAAEHGWTLRTAVVYANDAFDHAVVDGDEVITHRPVRPGDDRGDLVASYAIAKHRDGRKIVTVLHPSDIAKRRESSAYDAVWNAHPAAMWEKSAGRDVFGQLGLAEGDSAIQRMLNADELAHGEAAAALYGPPGGRTLAALPAGDTAASDASPSTTTSESASVGGGTQQAESAAAPETPAAGSAPDPDEEPDLDDTPAANAADEDVLVAAAREAAAFVVPNGKHKDMTLGEIHESGEKGQGWLVWALGKISEPEPYRVAVWNFCRVYLPDAYQAELAKQEAQVAA